MSFYSKEELSRVKDIIFGDEVKKNNLVKELDMNYNNVKFGLVFQSAAGGVAERICRR